VLPECVNRWQLKSEIQTEVGAGASTLLRDTIMEAFGVAITGASSGIGAALALKLARPGCRLALIGRNEARLAEVAASCRERGASCAHAAMDIREAAKLAAFLAQFAEEGSIDLLIANAGILDGRHQGHSVELPEAARSVLTINRWPLSKPSSWCCPR
jgi:NADP-dependent 3-hydroxy acid dehydrogenase YdfG